MKRIRTHTLLALVLFGTLVAGSGLTGSSMAAAGAEAPAGTDVTPSSAYVAPTAAATKIGETNIAHFEQIVHQGLNEGNLSIIDKYVSPTVIDHQYYGPGYPSGRGGIKALTAALRTAFPDLHAEATTLVASDDGNQTFAIIRTTGTNTGKYLGLPPTHRHIVLNIMESALWKNGVMVEHWGVADNIGLLAQMGLFPLSQFPTFSVDKLGKQYQEQLANPPTLHYRTATTPEAKLAAARFLTDVGVNQGDMYADSEYVAPNYVDYEYYGQGYPSKPVDKHKMAIAVNRTALPDLHTTIHELQVIGPMVFGILEAKGTNNGPYLGIPATGRKVDINVFEYWHFNSKGQVDVHNGIADLFGLISELGFVPPGSVPVYSPSKVDPKFLPELKKG
jgi:predicted ester cyclase